MQVQAFHAQNVDYNLRFIWVNKFIYPVFFNPLIFSCIVDLTPAALRLNQHRETRRGLCVFDCLHGNVCTPFEIYFTRKMYNLNTRNRLKSLELP